MMRITIPPEQAREIAPAGLHFGVCYAVCDLGTQNGPYGPKLQLYLAWELPEELTRKGKPHTIGKFYNVTPNEHGTLRQDLEGWFGRALGNGAISEINLAEALIGRTCTIGVMNEVAQNGRPRAKVTSVMLPDRGKPHKADPVNPPIVFGLEDGLDRNAYDALPGWLRTIVARSPEYQRALAPPKTSSLKDRLDEHLRGSSDKDTLDDSITF